jgi:hypothetical protein
LWESISDKYGNHIPASAKSKGNHLSHKVASSPSSG